MNPNLSFWERQSFFSGIDVAIIGSGLVGLSAALHLKEKEPDLRVVIFERGSIPTGANMDFQLNGNYEVFTKEENNIFKNCREQLDFFNKNVEKAIGKKDIYKIADSEISDFGFAGTEHLIKNNFEGQINTGKMMRRLLDLAIEKGIKIFNGISIQKIEEQSDKVFLLTEKGWQISTEKVLVTTVMFILEMSVIEFCSAAHEIFPRKRRKLPNLAGL